MLYADNAGTIPDASGTVLRIEKSSIHDGDGLRTVIFLKGCPLRCIWCSTPESQHSMPEIGYIHERCVGCGRCVEVCPNGVRHLDKDGKVLWLPEKCNRCMKCVTVCLSAAIVKYGEVMHSDEVVKEIEKDELFYFHSGGGVTISGGEPLEQAEFVLSILRKCSSIGISCAIESSFFAQWSKIEPLLPYVNLLYVDIKHPDNDRHKSFTGRGNETILKNLQQADMSNNTFRLIVRMPLIPGVNDGEDNMRKLARLTTPLRKLKYIELLAYHKLGVSTYDKLGRDYALPQLKVPNNIYMEYHGMLLKNYAHVPILINGRVI